KRDLDVFGAGFSLFHQRRSDALGNFALLLDGAALKPGDLHVRHGSSSKWAASFPQYNDGSPARRVNHRRVLESTSHESRYPTDAGVATAGPDHGCAARRT